MLKRTLFAIVLVFASVGGASAQKWDAPLFFTPRPMDDIGLYYTSTNRPFDDAAGLRLIWRQSGNLNLGVHVGTGDISEIGESILLGAEFYGSLARLMPTSGLALAWTLGLGATFGDVEGVDYIDFSIPAGVSVGLPLGAGGTTIIPFIHPRISFDVVAITINDVEETFTDVGFAADLGAEVSLGQRFMIRGAYTFGSESDETGDRDAFGIGVALRMQRPVRATR